MPRREREMDRFGPWQELWHMNRNRKYIVSPEFLIIQKNILKSIPL